MTNETLPLHLEEGELVCDKCNGTGSVQSKYNSIFVDICQKCQGDGKVDWISHITWKPPKEYDCNMNVAIGASALYKNTTGSYNVAIGCKALQGNISGDCYALHVGNDCGSENQNVKDSNDKIEKRENRKKFDIRNKILQWIKTQRDIRNGTIGESNYS